MVERRSLEPTVWVRVLVPDPLGNSLIGRTADSDSVNLGSSPGFPAIYRKVI